MSTGSVAGDDGRLRCPWGSAPDYVVYHDEEWGRPIRDDNGLYERLTFEGFQSGLSWLTILRKRENFRKAFAGFDIETVAAYDAGDRARLLADAGIIRHRRQDRRRAVERPRRRGPRRTSDGRHLAFRPGPTAGTCHPGRRTRPDRRVEGPGQGAQASRLPLRRSDHRLRPHAGRRVGQRPPRGLLDTREDPRMTRPHRLLPTASLRFGLATALVVGVLALATPSSSYAGNPPALAGAASAAPTRAAAASAATGTPTVLSHRTIGYSVRGHAIRAYEMGSRKADRTVVVIGAMHGNETAGSTVISALMGGKPIRGVHLWAIRRDNPDGVLAGHRRNAHGVDLNRNFPTKWKRLYGNYNSGPRPRSEPETRALMRFLDRIDPTFVVTMHSPLARDRRVRRQGPPPGTTSLAGHAAADPALRLRRRVPRHADPVVQQEPPGRLRHGRVRPEPFVALPPRRCAAWPRPRGPRPFPHVGLTASRRASAPFEAAAAAANVSASGNDMARPRA